MRLVPRRIARVTLLFIATTQLCCTSRASPMESEVDDLRHRLETASEHISQPVVTHRVGNHVTAQWEDGSSRSSTAYLDWVAGRLDGDYAIEARTESSIRFSKWTGGDAFYLTVKTGRANDGTLVQCTLEAMPD